MIEDQKQKYVDDQNSRLANLKEAVIPTCKIHFFFKVEQACLPKLNS